jgi:hypothetical protein
MGKINYFYGHGFNSKLLVYQRVGSIPTVDGRNPAPPKGWLKAYK